MENRIPHRSHTTLINRKARARRVASSHQANKAIQSLPRRQQPGREAPQGGTIRAGTPYHNQSQHPQFGGLRFGPTKNAPVRGRQNHEPDPRMRHVQDSKVRAVGARTAPFVGAPPPGPRRPLPSRTEQGPAQRRGAGGDGDTLGVIGGKMPASRTRIDAEKRTTDLLGRSAEESEGAEHDEEGYDARSADEEEVHDIDLEAEAGAQQEHRTGALAASHGTPDEAANESRMESIERFRENEAKVRGMRPTISVEDGGQQRFFPFPAETRRQITSIADGGKYTIGGAEDATLATVERYASLNNSYKDHQKGGILNHIEKALKGQETAAVAQRQARR